MLFRSSLWYHFDELTHHYIKVIPANIGTMLKPLGLAIWIMDDGYWNHGDKTVYLCTECFTETEVNLLISVLFDNFGLIATKTKRPLSNGEIRFRIRFSGKSDNIELLRSIVQSYFVPSMLYKLNLEA